jgi:nucleoside-diphosphate-sugar epimerase
VRKIILTGAAGFIGSHLTHKLLDEGFEVIGVDSINDLLYSAQVKEDRLADIQKRDNFTFYRNSICDFDWDNNLHGVDTVINLAALPGQVLSWQETAKYVEANTTSVAYLVSKLIQAKREIKLIQASTSSAYGENAWGDENQPLSPTSPYGITKLAAEQIISTLTRGTKVKFNILRYFSVYGPGQRPDMAISKFLNQINRSEDIVIYGDGTQIRDCTYVGDIINGTFLAIDQGVHGCTYNLGSGNPVSLMDILEGCFKVTGSRVPLRTQPSQKGDQLRTFADTKKARQDLNWSPKTSLMEGLQSQWKATRN